MLLVVLGGSAFTRAQTTGSCTPSFPFQDGWLGADAAYSIPLPDVRSVWIFGDTLYGDKRIVVGNEPRMVRNSIGISRCNLRAIRREPTTTSFNFSPMPRRPTSPIFIWPVASKTAFSP